jgi:hypothetical protein
VTQGVASRVALGARLASRLVLRSRPSVGEPSRAAKIAFTVLANKVRELA